MSKGVGSLPTPRVTERRGTRVVLQVETASRHLSVPGTESPICSPFESVPSNSVVGASALDHEWHVVLENFRVFVVI